MVAWLEFDKYVHIGIRPILGPRDGTEHGHFPDTILAAKEKYSHTLRSMAVGRNTLASVGT